MTCIAIDGKPRTGKTLIMTMMANDNFNKGHEIFSNYVLYFKHTEMDAYDMLNIPFNDVDRHPKTLLIQEADKWFNSKRSMRAENVLLGSLTGQSGKRNLEIIYDTQFPYRVDIDMRDIVEYRIQTLMPIVDNNKTPLVFRYIIFECMSYGFDYPVKIKEFQLPITIMQKYYSLYDSYQATHALVTDKDRLKQVIKPREKKEKHYY